MRHLPTGTVTLLFTDIEGSTHLLQQVGNRYASILDDCRRLLRAAFQEWNGYEVDTQGDAFFVAFARATDALSAAVTAQRSLATHQWSTGEAVRVRMGLHTGEPTMASEGYVGMDIHRGARIMGAGHGGQVLLSQTTRDLVEPHLPDGVSLRDMGEHHLKDLQGPSHLFQLVITGLTADFPFLNTLDACPNNLPMQPTPLVGREREMAAIEQLLHREEIRLVTLTGPGGMGKTRLALQVAANLSDLFPEGIYFVDLAPVCEPTLVIASIAQALRLREGENVSALERLKEELHQKQILLLLDNFEQVIDAAAQIADLLAACPRLKVLVTSRAVLRIRAEREFAVPPLAFPDKNQLPDLTTLSRYEAVALFIQRAQAVKSDFQLTEENALVVVDIAARLDGLPLAIELAAARMKLLSPETLLARLNQRLQLLTSGARDVAVRQRTLRNTIEWSYQLLDAQEQRLFWQLSIFAGGCSLEAVEAICAVSEDGEGFVLDHLTSLLDKSLLQRKEQGTELRFAMLETIRAYGLEVLSSSGEMEAMREAHAIYFLALAQKMEEELWGAELAAWLDRMEQEHDNIRAAMQWSLEQEDREIALRLGSLLRTFWYMRGHFSEGLDFLEQALAQSDRVNSSVRAGAVYAAARMNEARGNIQRAQALLDESLVLYRTLGDTGRIAYALHLQADMAWRRGDLTMARSRAEESLALLRQLDDRGAISTLLLHLGVLAADQGAYTRARALLEESLLTNRELEDVSGTADSLFNLARMYFLSGGDRTLARAHLEESFALHKTLGDKESIAYCLYLSGLLNLEEGSIASARSLVEQAKALFREMKQRHGTALSTLALAKVMAAQGDDARSRILYEESITLAMKADDKLNIASGLEGLAGVVVTRGRHVWATRLWGAAEALREAMGASLPPVERPSYDRAVADARTHLGTQTFAIAWTEGRDMTPEDALCSGINSERTS